MEDRLTSVLYARYPIIEGTTTTYMRVILAVLGVHRKYRCLFECISTDPKLKVTLATEGGRGLLRSYQLP
jgi:hypothetical protein